MSIVTDLHQVFQDEGLSTPTDYKIYDGGDDYVIILSTTLVIINILYGCFGCIDMSFVKVRIFSKYYYRICADLSEGERINNWKII